MCWEDLAGEDGDQRGPRGLKLLQRDPQLVLCLGWVLPEHVGKSRCVALNFDVSWHIEGGRCSHTSSHTLGRGVGWNTGYLSARTGSALTCCVPLTSHILPWPQFPPM